MTMTMTRKSFDFDKIKQYLNDNIEAVLEKLGADCSRSVGVVSCKCPVHNGDNPRSFAFYKNNKKWVCWTHNCHQDYGNDAIGLIKGVLSHQKGETASIKDVIKWIQHNIGKDIFFLKDGPVEVQKKQDIFDILNFIENNKEAITEENKERNDSKIPSDYFVKKRLYLPETMKEFGVGDSTLKTGISKLRSIIPVHNDNGDKVISNLYRAVNDWMMPKFLIDKNFKKTEYLYNFHRAKDQARKTSSLFLVEGTGDVWRLWEAGVKNVVSIFGKEFSERQVEKVDSLSVTNLIILIDNDGPGRESKVKIKRDLGRYYNLIFPQMPYKYKDVGKMSPKSIQELILNNLKGYYL